ncbi:hypothetical protein [Streptomyces jumonjinensis]|uniref:hypothetical protein n=1 Tax=Streptomyces jumonjinensis TaxID=1945 RepID=UPI00379F147E
MSWPPQEQSWLRKLPEVFATAGDALWVFTGYTGVAFDAAIQLSATAWTNRDLVSIGDHDNDGSADLLWRDHSTARLLLRHGKPATGGAGADLLSLASAASSKSGVDAQYGNGWTSAVIPLMTGSADVNKDGIPDIWAITGAADNGIVRFYPGGATHHADHVGVIFVDRRTHKALG